MKLTKKEQEKLIAEILNDLPEDYAFLSPYISLWLLNIVLVCIYTGILVATIATQFGLPITTALIVGLVMCVTFCLINVLLAQGYSGIGLRLVRLFSMLSIVAAMSIFAIKGYTLAVLVASVVAFVSVFVTHSTYFLVFVHHREKMMQWARERNKKNKEFKAKIFEDRRKRDNV